MGRLKEVQDLRKEVSSVIEKKRRVEGEVERLRGHLVSVEEGYTTELVEAEEREAGLRKRVATLEDQLRVVSVSSSEATQSASEASSQLNKALEAAANKRDALQVTFTYKSSLGLAALPFHRDQDPLDIPSIH